MPLSLGLVLHAACTPELRLEPPEGGPPPAWDGAVADAIPPPVTDASTEVWFDKLDLLLAVDNSASMGDKQKVLSAVLQDLILRLVTPNCYREGLRTGRSASDGSCPNGGTVEFYPLRDIHVGVVSSSLGPRGSQACAPPTPPSDSQPNDRLNDRGYLLNPTKQADLGTSNFLAWLPATERPAPAGGAKPFDRPLELGARLASLVESVGETGCGYEAQLESVYRFLMQPDPYALVQGKPADRTVALVGVDKTLLQQRHDFLRPDSLVAVIMVTDENDSALDPLALGGQAPLFYDWSYSPFRGSAVCKTQPASDDCRACVNNASGQLPAGCEGSVSTPPEELHPNLRPIRPRDRFGVKTQFPLERYILGFSSPTIPNRNEEHPSSASGFPQDYPTPGTGSCTNPLFAKTLPLAAEVDEGDLDGPVLCKRLPGSRTPDHVFFGVIGGVPWQLLAENPSASGRSVRFKASLTDGDWTKIVGRDPLRWDYQGIDPHMIESWLPRPGLATSAPMTGSDTADPMHGREWDTLGASGQYEDLQYACTFPLPSPRDCPKGSLSCDCESENVRKTPLCETKTSSRQVRGKAYPSLRPLTVARYLGKQAVVGSICPVDLTDNGDANSNFGYRPLLMALVDRMKPVLPKP